MIRRFPISAVLVLSMLTLAACKTPEERAQEYFESAMSFLAEGDEDRALIELRNVFQNDGFHLEARKTYADILRERGEMQEAYGQYLRLIEQYPNVLEVRLILAETAFASGNWEEVERHGRAAIEIDPENARARAMKLALDYRDAVLNRETVRRSDVAAATEAELALQPDNLVLRQIMIDHLVSGPLPQDAMSHVEIALSQEPDNLRFNTLKLRLLVVAEEAEAVGEQLKAMVALYPENIEVKQSMIRWHLSQQDFEGAEAFLRTEAGELTGEATKHLDVVRFVIEVRGREAGVEELNRLIAANEGTGNADLYSAVLANMAFEDGRTEEALATLEAVLADAEPSDQTRNIMAIQAQMYDVLGDREKAQSLVNTVLEEDGTNVDALKLRATWAIDEDRPGDAILDLRTASSQAPRDPEIMTILAAAFERDGSIDLAGEQLAKAVEASGSGVTESLRYARFLSQQGRLAVAETVLTEARRASNNNTQILVALSEVLLAQEEWNRVAEIADLLRGSDNAELRQAAEQIDAAILLGQNRIDEGIDLLQEQAQNTDGNVRSVVMVVMTQVRAGKIEEARTFLDDKLVEIPNDPALQLLSANLHALEGNVDTAVDILRVLIEDQPQAELPVRLLYSLLRSNDSREAAEALLDDAVERVADNRQLLWIRAGNLELEDRFEEAIAVYERIYAANSSDVIAANNLASMLSVHREDAESLERAYNIARRLRTLDVPAFKDTYGWIEYRRGNLQEAVEFLEDGAAGLPNDPLVQFHLGMAYADLGRQEEAITQFERMLELAEGRSFPQTDIARQRLEELTATE